MGSRNIHVPILVLFRMENGCFIYIAKNLETDKYIIAYTNYIFDDMLRLRDMHKHTVLQYYEFHDDVNAASAKYKRLRNWHPSWIDRIVDSFNPSRRDLMLEVKSY